MLLRLAPTGWKTAAQLKLPLNLGVCSTVITNGSTLNQVKLRQMSEQAPIGGRQLGLQADQHIHAEGKSWCCCHIGKAACP